MSQLAGRYVGSGFAVALAFLAVQFAAAAAQAADFDVGPMHIAEPWTRVTPKGASTAAGYMTITNSGSTPDRLSCVSSDAAVQCQIHTKSTEGDVMRMRPVEGGLEILPGQSITLKPGGLHMMFIDLKHPLEPGKTVEATLKFEQAGTVKVEYPILALGAPAPGAAAGGGGTMMQGGGMMQMSPKH